MLKKTVIPINKGNFVEMKTSNIALACYPLAVPLSSFKKLKYHNSYDILEKLLFQIQNEDFRNDNI